MCNMHRSPFLHHLQIESLKPPVINPPIDLNMLVPNFTLPVILRLDVMHILWSGPQNIRNHVHLEYLHLCESIHDLIATPQT